jgi:hypothetical protein
MHAETVTASVLRPFVVFVLAQQFFRVVERIDARLAVNWQSTFQAGTPATS